LMSSEGGKGKQEGHHWRKLILGRPPAWLKRVWSEWTLERRREEANRKGNEILLNITKYLQV
jgi:hypothetical protein